MSGLPVMVGILIGIVATVLLISNGVRMTFASHDQIIQRVVMSRQLSGQEEKITEKQFFVWVEYTRVFGAISLASGVAVGVATIFAMVGEPYGYRVLILIIAGMMSTIAVVGPVMVTSSQLGRAQSIPLLLMTLIFSGSLIALGMRYLPEFIPSGDLWFLVVGLLFTLGLAAYYGYKQNTLE